jgi:cation transporter-like permease
MTPVMKMNVTRVMLSCYPGDWIEKHILSILNLISHKKYLHSEEAISKTGDMERNEMKTVAFTILALIIGFAIGIMLSEFIGIIGILGFGRVIGIKYLSFYTAIALAILANLVAGLLKRKSGKA